MVPDNIGSRKYGAVIESPAVTESAAAWADVLLVTGTTLVNGSLPAFLGTKPVIFYKTTIAGAAYLMGWERFCACNFRERPGLICRRMRRFGTHGNLKRHEVPCMANQHIYQRRN